MAGKSGDNWGSSDWENPRLFGKTGKFRNKQTNTRMSFYLQPDRPDIPKGEEENFALLDEPQHDPGCPCCSGEGDTFEDDFSNKGWPKGVPKTYSRTATVQYKSDWIRYQSALDLRLRGPDFVDVDDDGTTQWGFCSKRSSQGFWKVTRTVGTQGTQVKGFCFEDKGNGVYWQKSLEFLDDPIKDSYQLQIQFADGLAAQITAGNIWVFGWTEEPNLTLNIPGFYQGSAEIGRLPLTGGVFNFQPNSIYKWISFFAYNPNRQDSPEYDETYWKIDGLYFSVQEPDQIIKLESF